MLLKLEKRISLLFFYTKTVITVYRKLAYALLLLLLVATVNATTLNIVSAYGQSKHFRRTVSILVPAVTQTEEGLVGVVSNLTVTVEYPGNGNVYVSTMPLTQIDMQASARTAAIVASTPLGYNPLSLDFYVSMESPAITIGGPSAGAAMTAAMVAALGGLQINHSVMLTGMINPDGTIGPVGGIKEKLEASAKASAKVFLVPVGQTIVYEQKVEYKKVGPFIFQTIKKVPVDVVKYGRELGVKVVEVSNIVDVVKYVLGINIQYLNLSAEEPELSDAVNQILKEQISYFRSEYGKIKELLLSIPKDLVDIVNDAEKLMSESEKLEENGLAYSAASKAFQALYTIDYAKLLLNYRNRGDTALEEAYREANATVESVKKALQEVKPEKLSDIGILIASHYRLLLAQKFLKKAGKLYSQGDVEEAIFSIAYAKWRAITAKLWLSGLGLGDVKLPSKKAIEKYSQTIVYEASSVVAYATSLLEDLGVSSDPILNSALEDLADSRNAIEKGDIYGGFGLALSSIAEATTAIHKYFTVNVEKQREAIEKVARGYIAKARELGIEPILALGYYEFAKQQKNALNEIYFYELSSMHAKALIDIYVIGFATSEGKITVTKTTTTEKSETTITPTKTNTTTTQTTTQAIEKQTQPLTELKYVVERVLTILLAFLGGLLLGYAVRGRSSATPG